MRIDVDDANERMQKKILRAQQAKVPTFRFVTDRSLGVDPFLIDQPSTWRKASLSWKAMPALGEGGVVRYRIFQAQPLPTTTLN